MVDSDTVHLGLDLGTSGMKGVACDGAGRVLARGGAGYHTERPEKGAAEQDPSQWLDATAAVVSKLAGDLGPRHVGGLSLSGMLPTLVLSDAGGRPCAPAVTWEDDRSSGHGDRLRDEVGGRRLYELTGQWVDGRYLLPMCLRIAEEQPATVRRAAALLGAKDYLFSWLTGDLMTDPSTAAGFGCFGLVEGAFLEEIVRAGDALSPVGLPPLPAVEPASTLRPLAPRPARRLGLRAGIPVCLGAADSVLGALGLGVRRAGDVAYVAGTSTVILAVSGDARLDPLHRYLVTPLADEWGYGLEMDLVATGSSLGWLAGVLGSKSAADVMALASAIDAADAPIVLPYLGGGEQGALWDDSLRGAIVGLELGHGPEHLARGLVNGILAETVRCLQVLGEAGIAPAELRAAGGSAINESFRQDLADATGMVVAFPSDGEADRSALGAAQLLIEATGGDLVAESGEFRRTIPVAGRQAMFAEVFARHDKTRLALHPPNPRSSA